MQALPLIFSGLAAAGQATVGLVGAAGEAGAAREKAAYQREMSELNARGYERQAGEIIDIGNTEAGKVATEGSQIIGAQRAGGAASNVDVSSGSAAAVQSQTRQNVKLDVMTVQNNAWRQAWGFKEQARQERIAGDMGVKAADNYANQTLLTGGLSAVTAGLRVGALTADYFGGGGKGGSDSIGRRFSKTQNGVY